MIHKTKGIALHTYKYGDNSIIAHIYTEQFGRQAFLIKGAYGKKALVKANLFQNLNLLELEVYKKSNDALQKLKEARNFPVYSNISFNLTKSTISLFIAEILFRVLREEEANARLYDFISSSIQLFDLETSNVADFHLIFLMQLTKFLGFFPLNNYSENEVIFDLLNGKYINQIPMHGYYLNNNEAKIFSSLIDKGYASMAELKYTKETRITLLQNLLQYYKLHISGMGNVKSLQVLKEVFG